MLRKLAASAVGAGALALVVGTPAFALSGHWMLTGPAWNSTFIAVSANLLFQAGATVSCASAPASGKVAPPIPNVWNSTGGGDPIITSLVITTSGCVTVPPPFPSIAFNLTQNGTASLYVTGVTGPTTPVEIRGLSVKGAALGGLCTAQADGPGGADSKTGVIGGTYGGGVITITGAGNMTIASASGPCALVGISAGDPASLSGSFTVTSTPVPVVTAVTP